MLSLLKNGAVNSPPPKRTDLICSYHYELFPVISAFLVCMNIPSFLWDKLLPISIPPVITIFSMKTEGSSERPVTRTTLNPVYAMPEPRVLSDVFQSLCQNLLLTDDVYYSIAFQDFCHFRLPSNFGKPLKEGFVNMLENETFSCALLLI